MKVYLKEILISLIVSLLLIIGIFILPISIGAEYLKILYWPVENLLFNKQTQRELTVLLFGRMTPNFAPIQFVLLTLFWTTAIFVFFRVSRVLRKKKF